MNSDEIELGWYGRVFRERWKLLIGGTLLGAVVGVAVTYLQPTLYEAVTTLLVVPPPKAPTLQINPATFRAILVNGSIAQQIINELELSKPPHRLTPQLFLEDALNVEQVTGTNVVRVRVVLRNPDLAAEASLRLAQKAILLTQELNRLEGASAQEQLKGHLDDASARTAAAEQELLAYQKRAQIELLQEDTYAMLQERGGLLKLTIAIESEKARLQSAELEIKKQDKVLPVRRALGAEESLRRTDGTTEVLDASQPLYQPCLPVPGLSDRIQPGQPGGTGTAAPPDSRGQKTWRRGTGQVERTVCSSD